MTKRKKLPPAPSRLERLARHFLQPGPLRLADALWLGLGSLLLVFVVLHPMILTSRYYQGSATDILALEAPFHEYIFACWEQRIWPWWNPYVFNGLPLQSGAHPANYPPLLLGLVVSALTEIWLYLLGHAWLATFGFALLMRFARLSLGAALMAAAGFGLGGFYLGHLYAGHLSLLAGYAAYPWVGLALAAALTRSGLAWTLLAGVATAWIITAGSYHMVYLALASLLGAAMLTALLGSRWVAPRLEARRPWSTAGTDRAPGSGLQMLAPGVPWRARLHDAGWVAVRSVVLLAVAAALTCGQWLPQLYSLPYFQVTAMSPRHETLPGWHLLTAFVPHLWERTYSAHAFTTWAGWEGQIYVSVGLLTCALIALMLPWRIWLVPALLAGISMLFSCGGLPLELYSRFDRLILWFIPATRMLAVSSFFLCWLAALGLQHLLSPEAGAEPGLARRRWLLGGVLLVTLCVWGALFYGDPESGWWHSLVQSVTTPQEWALMHGNRDYPERPDALLIATTLRAGLSVSFFLAACILLYAANLRANYHLFVLLVAADLSITAYPYMELASRANFRLPPDLAAFLVDELGRQRWGTTEPSVHGNAGWSIGIANVGGYSRWSPRDYGHAANVQLRTPYDNPVLQLMSLTPGPLWRIQGTRLWVTSYPPKDLPPNLKQAFKALEYLGEQSTRKHVYRDNEAYPRAFLVGEGRTLERDSEVYTALLNAPDLARRTVFLPAGELPPAYRAALPAIRQLAVWPNEVRVAAEPPVGCWLVLTDAYWPGWTAEVNGRPAPVLRANGGLHRAVRLEAGKNDVRFRYHPPGSSTGLAVSAITALVLMACAVATRRAKTPV